MISVILPVYRDAAALARTLAATDFQGAELIIVSTPDDESASSATAVAASRSANAVAASRSANAVAASRSANAVAASRSANAVAASRSAKALAERDIRWITAPCGRARQMNAGAAIARGEWLLFLHADTRLPSGWTAAIDQADRDPLVTAGCFRFALDSRAAFARAIELGVRVRVALFGLPYGDQAIFVRREVFEALRGYADLPIMEDVDLVRRLRRRGRLFHSPLKATTSARRWEQDGWISRTARHLALILLYFGGVPPARLARLDQARQPHPSGSGPRMSL